MERPSYGANNGPQSIMDTITDDSQLSVCLCSLQCVRNHDVLCIYVRRNVLCIEKTDRVVGGECVGQALNAIQI